MSTPTGPSPATESMQAAVGIVRAYMDHMTGGMSGKEYLQYAAAEVARINPLSLVDSLAMLNLSTLLPLAAHHEKSPEELLQKIAATVARGPEEGA